MTSKTRIGTDIVEIQRFRLKPLEKNRRFYNSIFTVSELMHCMKYSDPYPHLAGIFAVKEAIMKCLDQPVRMTDIEIFWNDKGRPTASIHIRRVDNVDVSIAHTSSTALGFAAILS